MKIACDYYDGELSVRRPATLTIAGPGRIAIETAEARHEFASGTAYIPVRVADTPRHVRLPDSASCVVYDNDALDALHARFGKDAFRRRPWVDAPHRLASAFERRWTGVATALALLAVLLYAAARWGAPLLGDALVAITPPEAETVAGEQFLNGLDRLIFDPSGIDRQKRGALAAAFEQARASLGVEARLEFRGGERIGANAFALPGGIVVITDELVVLAKHDEELIAVLAHELGHVKERHAMRMVARTSLLFVIWSAVTADVSVGAISAIAPEQLVTLGYSRDFEREADRIALEYLRVRDISASRLTDILRRAERAVCANCKIPSWLSTHPPTDERIADALE